MANATGPDPRGAQAIAVSTAFTVLAGIFVALRGIARFGMVRNCGIEDVFIIIAFISCVALTALIAVRKYCPLLMLVLGLGPATETSTEEQNGMGRHIDTLAPGEFSRMLKVSYPVLKQHLYSPLELTFIIAFLGKCHCVQHRPQLYQTIHLASISKILCGYLSPCLLDSHFHRRIVWPLDLYREHHLLSACGLLLGQDHQGRSLHGPFGFLVLKRILQHSDRHLMCDLADPGPQSSATTKKTEIQFDHCIWFGWIVSSKVVLLEALPN